MGYSSIGVVPQNWVGRLDDGNLAARIQSLSLVILYGKRWLWTNLWVLIKNMDSERGPVDGEAGAYTGAGCSAVGVDLFASCLANRPLDPGIDIPVKDRQKQGEKYQNGHKNQTKFWSLSWRTMAGNNETQIYCHCGEPLCLFRNFSLSYHEKTNSRAQCVGRVHSTATLMTQPE